MGSINNLDGDGDPFVNTIYGHGSSYVWSRKTIMMLLMENIWEQISLMDIMYEDQLKVLNFKLIEMDETISFRYWRLLFNKSTGQDDYVAEHTVYDTTYEPFTRYDESQKFHAPMDGEGGYWGEEYFGCSTTFTGSRQLSLSPYVNQNMSLITRPKFIVNNPSSSIKLDGGQARTSLGFITQHQQVMLAHLGGTVVIGHIPTTKPTGKRWFLTTIIGLDGSHTRPTLDTR